MSRVRDVNITAQDSPSIDAFGRWRTSGTGQRLDVEFLYDKQEDYFDETTNNGTVTHNTNSRDLTLSISDANNGTYADMSSYPVPYTPGNSQLIDITGVLDLANIGGGTAQCFLRSNVTGSVVETTTDQSSWENATSGVDWADSHILSIDLQSLKVGRVRFNLVQNGMFVKICEINNDNVRNTGYWQLANLPTYWRLYNDATYTYMEMGYGDTSNAVGIRYRITANASATMRAICCTVKSEGGEGLREIQGLPASISSRTTKVTVSNALIPIISIRMKSTFQSLTNQMIALPKSYTLEASNPVNIRIIEGATLTGASWTDVDATHSCMEYDVSATAVSGGHIFVEDFVSTNRNVVKSGGGIFGKSVMWDRQSTNTGILTIAAIRTGTNDADCLAGLGWDELR